MTVLFSDVRGFTAMSEKGSPEEVVAQLNEYFSRMVQVVFDHRGTVDKFVGDMVMALYGAPLDDDDHAEHAMQTAVAGSGHFYPEMHRQFPAEHGCPWVKGGLYIDRHGGMTTCCMIKDTARHGLGKLGVTPPEAVLAQRQAIDAALTAAQPPEQCRGCAYYRTPERREALRRRIAGKQRRQAKAAKPG